MQQTLPRACYEVLVCDDGPSPVTQKVVDAFSERAGQMPAVRYLPVTATQGPAGARNVGWRSARAPVIAFTDDDTMPEPGWLQAGLDALASGADAATGRVIMPLPERPSDYERDAARLETAEFVTANCFVLKQALEAAGGFDERYTRAWREDSDLHFTLLEQGRTIIAAPGAVVIHPLRPAHFGASIGMQRKVMFDVLLFAKHPRLYRERIRPRPPWFYLITSASLLLALLLFATGRTSAAVPALALWAALSLAFFLRRLLSSALSPRNFAELLLTSFLIPPLSLFWRAVGAARFGWNLP